MIIKLDGKRTIVTGGSSGIGEAIARALAEAGAKVVVNFHGHAEHAQTVVKSIVEKGGAAIAVQADVADPNSVAAMFQRIDAEWGGIDILINNAGIDGTPALAWEAEPNAWKRVIGVNLFGAFHCAREALKRMIPRKSGVVVNITSVHEQIPWSHYSAYTASKAALSMMSQTLAQEAASHGVRVLAVAPGAIQTPINRSVWEDPEGKRDLLSKIPMNRMGQPEEIARMVLVLVSDVASYVTGRTIFVDGGMTDYPSFSHGG